MKTTHRLAALGLTAALAGGGVAGLALGLPGVASADSGSTPSATSTPAPGGWVHDTLTRLVTDGTLTQAQADAVQSALDAARPARPDHPGRHGTPGLDAAAGALGVTTDELRQDLAGGETIAGVAAAKGVDVQTVIDAMVADAKAHLAQAVADGHLTQDQADQRLAEVTDRVTQAVNGTLPAPPPGGPHGPAPDGASGPTPSA